MFSLSLSLCLSTPVCLFPPKWTAAIPFSLAFPQHILIANLLCSSHISSHMFAHLLARIQLRALLLIHFC